ncbi:alpha/beta-hydrolase [Lophiostoma macrostomum CBS 122681]|uniref:Alpha/beta-hydrolase n=1 Tax=Lophiostoma macrostomum CBS 122681 TaxID=1314788 RepID=A0A6A6TNZ0_9PLEO|nr:alpha/beta-hydrolase [Lophiostoma macrostomum CBS 122681]
MKLISLLSHLLTAQPLISAAGFSLLPRDVAATAATDKPVIIMVPGAFHPATVYTKVIEELEKSGYDRSVAIPLPSVGELVSRQQDIEAVRSVLRETLWKGRDVVLVGNSYGGTVIGEAVKGYKDGQDIFLPPPIMAGYKTGKVLGLVFLAGYLPYISEVEHPETKQDIKKVSPKFFRFTDDGKVLWDGDMANEPPEVTFYNDLPKDEAKQWAARLQFSSYDALNATATYIPYTGDFKCTYVIGTKDNSIPEAFARTYINQPGANFTVRVGDWDHVSMLSHPDKIALLIREAAGETSFDHEL